MKICHVCGAETEDNSELCPKCGAQLKSQEEIQCEINAAEAEKKAIINNPVLAASVGDMVTAEIYCDVLDENGISYSYDDEGSVRVSFGGGFVAFDIYVDESDLERARELYEQVLESESQYDEDFGDETDMEEE